MKQIIIIEDQINFENPFFNNLSNNVYNNIDQVEEIMPDDKLLFFFQKNLDFKDIKNKIKKTLSMFENIDVYFMIPSQLKGYFQNEKNCILFPIKISDLKTILKKENHSPIKYNNLELENGILKNLDNNKHIKLSDIEKKIIKLLFFKNKVQKNIIKVSILNYKTETTSNSVESLLSRIRNKLENINSFVKIVSNEKGVISIKNKD